MNAFAVNVYCLLFGTPVRVQTQSDEHTWSNQSLDFAFASAFAYIVSSVIISDLKTISDKYFICHFNEEEGKRKIIKWIYQRIKLKMSVQLLSLFSLFSCYRSLEFGQAIIGRQFRSSFLRIFNLMFFISSDPSRL